MAQKNKGPGIQSAAGLIRYFDAEEESAVKIPPVAVLVFGIVVGIAVILLRIFWNF
jgi:preprotein translocase subunit Sec61beta